MRAVDSRVCPADVDVVRFLAEAMRSIAHGEREKAEYKLVLVAVPKSGEPRPRSWRSLIRRPTPRPS